MIVKKKTTVELLNESEKVSLYSISFEMDGTTEFEKFVAQFELNATYNRDYQRIIAALQAILRIGALERFFRPEGGINDSVQALPIESGKLRLYCLRLSDQIVILGNGGAKNTPTYNEDPKLYGYVLDLQKFEKILNDNIAKGYVSIKEKELSGVEDITFEIEYCHEKQTGMVQRKGCSSISGDYVRSTVVGRHHCPHRRHPQEEGHDPTGPCKKDGALGSRHIKMDFGFSQPHTKIHC